MPLGLSICLVINVTVGVFVLLREEWALYAMAALLLAIMSAAVISAYGLFEKPKEPESTTQSRFSAAERKAEVFNPDNKGYKVGTVLIPEKFLLEVAPEVDGCRGCYFRNFKGCTHIANCEGIIYKQILEDESRSI